MVHKLSARILKTSAALDRGVVSLSKFLTALLIITVVSGGIVYVAQESRICTDICIITLESDSLKAGSLMTNSTDATASFSFSISNPGASSLIQSIVLTEAIPPFQTIHNWGTTPALTGYTATGLLVPGHWRTTDYTLYPIARANESQILGGQTYSFLIMLENNQSISGQVTAS